MNIILASASKRRSAILDSCGIRHKVVISNVKERVKHSFPHALAIINACLKARAISVKIKSGYIIGADTVVKLGRKVIGKPRDAKHARSMLSDMSGKDIYVYTGLCVIDAKSKKEALGYERTLVKVKKINRRDIARYFSLLGPYDKAGGFSIEGAGSFIFDNINGSYFNVLGLPMARLKELFMELGADILKYTES